MKSVIIDVLSLDFFSVNQVENLVFKNPFCFLFGNVYILCHFSVALLFFFSGDLYISMKLDLLSVRSYDYILL